MEGIMVNEMFWTHCCHCGYRISKSAPGTKSLLVCPKCGSELEVAVDGNDNRITNISYDSTSNKVAYTYDSLGRVNTRAANSYTPA